MSFFPAHDDEEDSLFGSPPPSPGRSPSPALALPGRCTGKSGSNASTVTQNVGTIALPGSQPSSELFVDPLAPSLAATIGLVQPMNPASRAVRQNTSRNRESSVLSIGSSFASGISGQSEASTTQRPRKRKARTQSKDVVPRPEIQIPLPDPSLPIPANFLRSQSALLGVAGLVGGVNPSQLKLRGTTSNNPIVIEDEPRSRNQSRQSSKLKPKPRLFPPGLSKETRAILESIDLSEIPVPSKQEILAVLIKEKDIVPIMRSLMKSGKGANRDIETPTSGPRWSRVELQDLSESFRNGTRAPEAHTAGHQAKKRKLSSVPAGADDWDVPYPFPEGQGPESYQDTWQSERGKQLISQLVNLTKVATRKAAVQKFFKMKGISIPRGGASSRHHVEEEPRINKYYKPITATYGLQCPPSVSAAGSRQGTPASGDNTSQPSQRPNAVPSSSKATSPAPTSSSSTPAPEDSAQETESLDQFLSSLFAMSQQASQPAHDLSSASGANEDLINNWMHMLQPETPAPSADMVLNQSTSSSSSNLGFSSTFTNLDALMFSAFLPPQTVEPQAMATNINPPPTAPAISDDLIDPDLLALGFSMESIGGNLTASSAPSPMLSLSPFTGGPSTPVSADWDATIPDVFDPLPNPLEFDLSAGAQDGNQGPLDGWEFIGALDKMPPLDQNGNSEASDPMLHIPNCEIPSSAPPIQSQNEIPESNNSKITKSNISTQKEEVIRKVRERKAQLEAELKKVKLQLWEATIEQGGLNHVLQHYQEKEQQVGQQILAPIDNTPSS